MQPVTKACGRRSRSFTSFSASRYWASLKSLGFESFSPLEVLDQLLATLNKPLTNCAFLHIHGVSLP